MKPVKFKQNKEITDYAIKKVNEIIKFSNQYHMWIKKYPNPSNELEIKSNVLYNWLGKSEFFKGRIAFKYRDIYIKDTSLYDIIYKIYSKYSYTIQHSEDNWRHHASQVIEFCNKYNEWPRAVIRPKTEKDLESMRLNAWLQNHELYRGRESVKIALEKASTTGETPRGVSTKMLEKLDDVIDMIDEKYQMYKDQICAERNAIKLVEDIETYCKKTGKWINDFKNPKTPDEINSRRLYSRLYSSSYLNSDGSFKYYNIILDNKMLLGDKLNKIALEYKIPHKNTDEYQIYMTKKVCEYCVKYQSWPTVRQGNSLYMWLKKSGFPENFKYKNIYDINCNNIFEELINYYKIYGKSNQTYNINKVKSKTKNLSNELYLLSLKLIKNTLIKDQLGYDIYTQEIKNIIKENKLNINSNLFIKIFDIEKNEGIELIGMLRNYYRLTEDKTLTQLFDNLFKYFIKTEKELKYDKRFFLKPIEKGN